MEKKKTAKVLKIKRNFLDRLADFPLKKENYNKFIKDENEKPAKAV